MIIIPQNRGIVNIYVDKNVDTKCTASDKTALRLARARTKREERREDARRPVFARWQYHKQLSQQMAARLAILGLTARAERMYMCGSDLVFDKCADCGHVHVRQAQLCRDRLCPTCNWRLSLKRYARMSDILAVLMARYPGATYTLVTLTVANCAGSDLSRALSDMQSVWHYCVSQRWHKDDCIGWARSVEVTYSTSGGGSLHPHYHVIMATYHPSGADRFVDEWLRQAQKHGVRAVRAAQHIDEIKSPDVPGASLAGAVCEVYKYTVKTDDLLGMPLSALRDLAAGLKSRRLISFGGAIKTIAAELDVEDIDADDTDDEGVTMCSECKSQRLDEITLRWAISGNKYIASVRDDVAAAAEVQMIIDNAVQTRDKEANNEGD